MYRFSRALYLELKDIVDPHPDTISVTEARRRVLEASQATVERLASDPRYFPQPARSLFQQIRCYFPISQQARVFYAIERMVSLRPRVDPGRARPAERGQRPLPSDHPQGQGLPAHPAARPRVLPVALASRGALHAPGARRRSRLSESPRGERAMIGACTTCPNS